MNAYRTEPFLNAEIQILTLRHCQFKDFCYGGFNVKSFAWLIVHKGKKKAEKAGETENNQTSLEKPPQTFYFSWKPQATAAVDTYWDSYWLLSWIYTNTGHHCAYADGEAQIVKDPVSSIYAISLPCGVL